MPKILLVISNSFSRRFIASEELLQSMAEDFNAESFVVEPKLWDKQRSSISRRSVNIKAKVYNYIYKYRFIFFEDYFNNIALLEKYLWLKNSQQLRLTVVTLLSKFRLVRYVFKIIELWTLRDRYTLDKLRDYDILVVTYAVNYFEANLLYNASVIGIKTINAVLSWDNIMCKGHFPILPNYFLAWGEEMRNEILAKYNFDKKKIFLGGVPHFCEHNNESPKSDYIVFVMSAQRFAPTELEIIRNIHDSLNGTNISLCVRPHPQNLHGPMSSEDLVMALKCMESLPKLRVVWPRMNSESEIPTFEPQDSVEYRSTLKNALCVINSGSTASVEALLLNTPVILSSFDMPSNHPFWHSARRLINFPHLQKLLKSNGIHVAYSLVEVMQFISKIDYQNIKDEYLKSLVHATGHDSVKLITNAIKSIHKN